MFTTWLFIEKVSQLIFQCFQHFKDTLLFSGFHCFYEKVSCQFYCCVSEGSMFFSLWDFQQFHYDVPKCGFLYIYSFWGQWCSMVCELFQKILSHVSSSIVSVGFCLSYWDSSCKYIRHLLCPMCLLDALMCFLSFISVFQSGCFLLTYLPVYQSSLQFCLICC